MARNERPGASAWLVREKRPDSRMVLVFVTQDPVWQMLIRTMVRNVWRRAAIRMVRNLVMRRAIASTRQNFSVMRVRVHVMVMNSCHFETPLNKKNEFMFCQIQKKMGLLFFVVGAAISWMIELPIEDYSGLDDFNELF